ncbi:Rv2175c family DNA-binding protein [Curtobacterium sp. Leaf261]|uniref:Rv2175c family DNA-binding protein n=1 Tax=Curtobacterium sp. Leaf261 TaxID=1736311 RepID=UPI000AD1585C
MSDASNDADLSERWLTVPDLMELLQVSPGRIHRLFEERTLLPARVDGVLRVPVEFLGDTEPLPELKGTLVVLGDNHFTDDEAVRWMLTVEESIGVSPIAALRAGRKAEVRRVAQTLL